MKYILKHGEKTCDHAVTVYLRQEHALEEQFVGCVLSSGPWMYQNATAVEQA